MHIAPRIKPVVEELRRRILSGLQLGSLHEGDRPFTVRSLAAEFCINLRVALAACSELEGEGLLVRRSRSGLYVAKPHSELGARFPHHTAWMADVFLEAWNHGISGTQFAEYAREWFQRLRLRAVVAECNADQRWSFSDELAHDFGFLATAFDLQTLLAGAPLPQVVEHADMILTTAEHTQPVRQFGARLGVPVFVVTMDTSLLERLASLLHKGPVYFVAADSRFADKLRRLMSTSAHADNFRPLVVGRDSMDGIPHCAPLYVSRLARQQLAGSPVLARTLPPARVISPDAARELLAFAASRTAAPPAKA